MLDSLADAAKAAGQALQPETLALAGELRQARERVPLSAGAITPPVAVTGLAAAPPQNKTSATIARTANQENSVPPPPVNSDATQEFAALPIEPAGGAVPVQLPYYIEREGDAEFHAALARSDSILVIWGARQVGKTSLMARGLHRARQAGMRVVVTDFQKINAEQLVSANTLYLALAESLAIQLDLDVLPGEDWNLAFGPNMNLERYLRRRALRAFPEPLVWCLDEVDRLFTCSFGQEVFGLFRSWHNERALDPACPWSRRFAGPRLRDGSEPVHYRHQPVAFQRWDAADPGRFHARAGGGTEPALWRSSVGRRVRAFSRPDGRPPVPDAAGIGCRAAGAVPGTHGAGGTPR